LLVTHLVARSRQFLARCHPKASAVSYSSEHRFALSRQRVDSAMPLSPWFRQRYPMATLFQARYYRSSQP